MAILIYVVMKHCLSWIGFGNLNVAKEIEVQKLNIGCLMHIILFRCNNIDAPMHVC